MNAPRELNGQSAIELLPEDAPFSADQRAWLNGFFAGLLTRLAEGGTARAGAAAATPPQRLAVKVLYASQTGTAESLARKLTKEARNKGFAAESQELGSMSLEAVARLEHVVLIASTHGDGEPPDSAGALAAQLASARGRELEGLKYAVLALGDSSYVKFCNFGKLLDDRFAQLGATRLIERIESDTEVDGPFKAFRERLWPVLHAKAAADGTTAPAIGTVESGLTGVSEQDEDDQKEPWTRDHPFAADLRSKAVLNGAESDKEVRHIVLSLKGSGITYEPGDALGVWPSQAPDLVEAILSATGISPDTPVTIGAELLALSDALATRRELTVLTPPTVIKFADMSEDMHLCALTEPDQSAALQEFLQGKDPVDLLQSHRGAVRDAQSLVNMLPPLKPRLYSISSSQAAFPDEVHLTIAAVRYDSGGRRRGGVASTWFADRLEVGRATPVFVQRNTRFRLPADAGAPVVMIGPGTGLAPFRAFLHHRRSQHLTGRTWLFFGDRHCSCDFLYRAELESFLDGQELSRLDTAFSRDQRDKVYVQHRMIQAGKELWRWLQDGAWIYVCGDASRMARDVDAALRTIFVEHGRRSPAQAQLELRELAAAGRYVRDVY